MNIRESVFTVLNFEMAVASEIFKIYIWHFAYISCYYVVAPTSFIEIRERNAEKALYCILSWNDPYSLQKRSEFGKVMFINVRLSGWKDEFKNTLPSVGLKSKSMLSYHWRFTAKQFV